jgi:hypothetical protein
VGYGKKNLRLNIFWLSGIAFLMCWFWSCASTGSFAAVDSELGRNRFAESVEALERKRKSLYGPRDDILFYLDKGMLTHYAQQYAESSSLLEEAERAIDKAFTVSVTQEISTFLVNDNARDYGGEDYEDVYINVFNALNYYHRGEHEGAMVEIRRASNKLRNLSVKYDAVLSNLQRKALEDGLTDIPPNPNTPVEFNDSALARYLGILFYRGAGLRDNARVDRDWLRAAFANAPAVYNFPVPSSISGELEIPAGMARLNVLAFGGLSPEKKENVIRIPLPGPRWIKIALPEMVSRRSEITRVELVLDSGGSHQLELLESIDAVARSTFKLREQVIYLKTIIRALIQGAGSSALTIASRETEGRTSLVLEILSVGTQVIAEATERADVRISRYFPAHAYVTGINLPPGRYSFQVKFYGRGNREIASVHHRDMEIRDNALNLVEAVCLK